MGATATGAAIRSNGDHERWERDPVDRWPIGRLGGTESRPVGVEDEPTLTYQSAERFGEGGDRAASLCILFAMKITRMMGHLLWVAGLLTSCSGPSEAPDASVVTDTSLLSESKASDLRSPVTDPYDSGGVMLPEQAAYDVLFYDLAIEVLPDEKALRGRVGVEASVGSPLAQFVLDLDSKLDVTDVIGIDEDMARTPLPFERRGGKIWISLGRTFQPGERISVEVGYGGQPREAVKAPWDGGVTWGKTPSGEHWIATTCQTIGADVWWPVKDHVSDEPDSMNLHVTVPKPLVAACNGRLERVDETETHRTYNWYISTPINVYNVALNIAPYDAIETEYTSVTGETMPVTFWVLPEDVESGRQVLPEFLDHLRFFEEVLGPYPFRADKYGIAQTPHLGMEHQTIIAYGANFDNGAMTRGEDWGFDALHHHELSHEWWGNLVTNAEWSDMWIHEGFGSYMQPLYLEARQGKERYHAYMASVRDRMTNEHPLADRRTLSAGEIYGSDIYFKGAWVLHTLRYLIGNEAFGNALRRMAYPNSDWEARTDGSQCRFVRTDDFVSLVERITTQDLDWFFEVYVRQPKLPELVIDRADDAVTLHWMTVGELAFPMPVQVSINGEVQRVEVSNEPVRVAVPAGAEVEIDPNDWILREK